MPVRFTEDSSGPSTRRTVITHEMAKDLTYYTLSKAELQKLAEARGLPKSGTKDDLIQRLQARD